MKYPVSWDADSKVRVHSRYTEAGKVYGLSVWVHKPGTVNHQRRITTEMTRAQMVELHDCIEALIEVKPAAEEMPPGEVCEGRR